MHLQNIWAHSSVILFKSSLLIRLRKSYSIKQRCNFFKWITRTNPPSLTWHIDLEHRRCSAWTILFFFCFVFYNSFWILSEYFSTLLKRITNLADLNDFAQFASAHTEAACSLHRQQIQHYTNQVAKETNKYLKDLGSIPLPSSPSEQVSLTLSSMIIAGNIILMYVSCVVLSCVSPAAVQRQQKLQRERLMNDFSSALNNFQAVQRQAAEKEKESVARARAGSRISVRRRLGGALHPSGDPLLGWVSLRDSTTTGWSSVNGCYWYWFYKLDIEGIQNELLIVFDSLACQLFFSRAGRRPVPWWKACFFWQVSEIPKLMVF